MSISAFLLRIIGLAHLWRLGRLVGNSFAEMYCLAISSIVLTIKNQTSSLLIISTTLATSLHTSANQFWSALICGRRSSHNTLESVLRRNRFARPPRHEKHKKRAKFFYFALYQNKKMLIITSLQPYGFPTVGPSNDYPCVQLAYCIWFAYW